MKSIITTFLLAAIAILLTTCNQEEDKLYSGIIIKESIVLEKDTFFLDGSNDWSKPSIIIEGKDIVVDFNGSVIIGSKEYTKPNTFKGIGIDIRNGENIYIKNVTIKGYKIGVRATAIKGLKIDKANLSYNYRAQLKSTWEKPSEEDQMSFYQNGQEDWESYGAALYLKKCNNAEVKNLWITGGQNGLMMSDCNDGLFYNNRIRFNSGFGIALHQSSNNKVLHNQLDWNIRGFNFGIYNQKQNTSGIFLNEESNKNTIAFNTATHSANGILIKSSCDENIVYKNNFSNATNEDANIKGETSNWFLNNTMNKPLENASQKNDQIELPKPLPDGINTFAADALSSYTGQKHIIMDDFGPYNFKYPKLILRSIEADRYTFAIFGPFGNWKAIGGKGFKLMSQKTGTIPATLVLEKEKNASTLSVDLEYLGPEFVDAFGRYYKKGFPYKLKWENKNIQ